MTDIVSVDLALTPEGHVYLNIPSSNDEYLKRLLFDDLSKLFAQDSVLGLLHLGLNEFADPLPPTFFFWHSIACQFILALCKVTPQEQQKTIQKVQCPEDAVLVEWMDEAPGFKGGEYLNPDTLRNLWGRLNDCFQTEFLKFAGSFQDFLKQFSSHWNSIGRVCFHLAENKGNPDYPFAFLATYISHLSDRMSAQHLPLKKALQDYAGEKNHAAMLALLEPVQKAANQSFFVKQLVDNGGVFHPLKWTAKEAYQFLKDVPLMETSGLMVRIPNWWNAQKPSRPRLSVKIGDVSESLLGFNTILDFDAQMALEDGTKLSEEEIETLLNSSDNLVKIKEQWVEVDRNKLQFLLKQWKKLSKASRDGITLSEGVKFLSGSGGNLLALDGEEEMQTWHEWTHLIPGDWLKSTLGQLKNPEFLKNEREAKLLKKQLNATLRSYQMTGVQWLWFLYQLKLGGCLADDMGLGKTIQVISLFLLIKDNLEQTKQKKAHLLVVPASLLGNWQAEVHRFAPQLKLLTLHSSVETGAKLASLFKNELSMADVVLTTYGFLHRLPDLIENEWDLVVLDEAQSIKNPTAKQTKVVKTLKSQVRLALTGTPIENRLGDLWSLFDFISPGLLGSSKQFSDNMKQSNHPKGFTSVLRHLTQPYILRRLKSDKNVISDLPDKTEMQTYCSLSKEQIKLYQQSIEELQEHLKKSEGIQRKGLVLSYLLRFKQICNHPTQWLGYGGYLEEASGKFARLREICEEIAAKQEKVLVFSQFREIIPALDSFLKDIFGKEGLTLDGSTKVKKRADLVSSFQEEMGPPYFILSIKAGGTGLNLTRASHVIHFDRWWNPAVENQATDRAYRIGQKKSVMVHKFICRGTIEEKIDELISSKKTMSNEVLSEGGEVLLTELSNDELLRLISLDLTKAVRDY